MLSLIEKVEDSFGESEALQMQKKLKRNEFTLEDFRDQLRSAQNGIYEGCFRHVTWHEYFSTSGSQH